MSANGTELVAVATRLAAIEATPDIRNDPDFQHDWRTEQQQIDDLNNAATRKALKRPREPSGNTGIRPILNIAVQDPPQALVAPFLATDAEVVLYGPGGAGKGTTAVWLALQVVRMDTDANVAIADFEHRQNEWASRARRLGATDAELARLHYTSPYSPEWTLPTGSLIDIASHVKTACDDLNATMLIVDSYSAATSSGDAMGGKEAADEYFRALRQIGRRSLTLAHVPGSAQKWPDRPFGSVFVHNFARETWAIERIDMDTDAGEDEHGLNYHRVELRNKKAQDRLRPPNQRVTFTYEPHFGPITAALDQATPNHGALVYDALKDAGVKLTVKQIIAAVRESTGDALTEKQVHQAIRRRNQNRGDIEENNTIYPRKYGAN